MISVHDGGGEQGNAVGDGLDWESHRGDVRPEARNLSVRCAVEAHELAGHDDRRPRHGASLSIAHFFGRRELFSARFTLPTPHQTTKIEPIPLIVAPSASMLGPPSALGSSGACGEFICQSVLYLRSRLSLSSSSSAVSGASVQKLKRSGVAGDRKMGQKRVQEPF